MRQTSLSNVTLLFHPDAGIPKRFAHVESQRRLVQMDMSPCPCGAPFRDHDWVLTVRGEITVLACSREHRADMVNEVADRMITVLARSMLSQAVFPHDPAAASQIWNELMPETREDWLKRAGVVIDNLNRHGYKITEG